jgi:diguanylate cyclase (GGDEF)-like protein
MDIRNRIKNNKGFSFILLLSTILWALSVGLFLINNNTLKFEIIDIESKRALDHYENVLHTVFDQLTRIEVFTETVGIENLTEEKFESFIAINDFENIGFISLSIAPGGVIEYYHADEYEDSLIGLDLINDERVFVREAVQYAIDNDVVVINGPFILIQGGNGLVFRKAIYEDDEFVAIINLVIGYENLNTMFAESSSNVVELGIYDSDNNLMFGSLEYSDDLDFYDKMHLDNIDWNVGVNVEKRYEVTSLLINITILTLSTLLYIFAVVFGTKFYRSNKDLLTTQKKLINYDNLTGLPNRRKLSSDIKAAIKRNKPFFLGFGDLDNFKNLNDILGHSVGDNYLIDISNRFHRITNDNITIYRWGGDEFIFFFNCESKEDTIILLNEIYIIFKEPIIIKETNYNVSMSIGVVNFPDHGNTIDDLVKRADIVMYDIKSTSKNSYGFFEDKYLDNLQREVDFENKVYEYSMDEIEVYLQPVISLESNEIVGFEALTRLFDKKGNLINTGEMIKVYERKGDIFKLDKYIVEKAFQYSVKLKEEFNKNYSISFNISPITLSDEYIEFLKYLIKKYNVKAKYFVIEIIETTGFKDINESVLLLNKLRKVGFRIAMDDFGMGYSSLSYITRLPLTLIKIDRDFVQNYQTNEFDKMLILTIRDISKSLNLQIVVEGIETKEQLEFVRDIGAHYYQGYLHSKPMSFDNIRKLLK